jgi:5-methylcytosine-specific restriction protein A
VGRIKYADPRVSYGTTEWAILKARQLKRHKDCVYCLQMGLFTKATHVDHKVPHRGNYGLFRDPNNLQSLCAVHANSTKQKEELTGQTQGCAVTGWPLGKEHFWNGGPRAPPKVKNQQQIAATHKPTRRKRRT